MNYFDYEKTAREAHIAPERLEELRDRVQHDFPGDEMMCELHLLRLCMAIQDGALSLDEALRPELTAKT
jgi:hypothetical protein